MIVGALVASGCAGNLEKAAARHDANAFVLDAAGDREAALREREKAERARDKLEWRSGQTRDYVPPLTAFSSF
ncbi:MAG TPA: hypothetical protein VGH63_02305 [Polyangia bacterium]